MESIQNSGRNWFEEFDRDGYLVIRDLFPRELIDLIQEIVNEKIALLFQYIKENNLPFGIGVKNGFQEIVQRQANRFEIKLADILRLEKSPDGVVILNPTNNELLAPLFKRIEENSTLIGAVEEIFQKQAFRIIHQSCVVSLPGTEEQKWHSDGPHVSVTEYLPCHVFNCFLPLIDMTDELGPTEIRPESQHYTFDLTKAMLLAKLRKQIKPVVKPILKKGDALFFDYRVLHRGGPNISTESRPILVFTFAKSWYTDNLNFPKKSIYDPLPLPSPPPPAPPAPPAEMKPEESPSQGAESEAIV